MDKPIPPTGLASQPQACQTCQTCLGLLKPAGKHRLFLEFSPAQLQQSALREACQPCKVLLEGVQEMQNGAWSFAQDVSKVYGYALSSQNDTLTLELYFRDERPRITLEFFSEPGRHQIHGQGQWQEAFGTRSHTNGPPLSPSALRWVRERLSSCSSAHRCLLSRESPGTFLPTRLLSLSKLPNGVVRVHLVNSQTESPRPDKYATLSHCWGDHLSCTTTTGNLRERFSGIPWADIPKTFRDAIQYCIELDITYLWVDSLCILQDDVVDWEVESAKMAAIYRNSYLTIAATAASSGTVGCFSQAMDQSDKLLQMPDPTGDSVQISVRHKLLHWDDNAPTTLAQGQYPLLTRGWAFQERVLSPRVLHFLQKELVWECWAQTICECGGLTILKALSHARAQTRYRFVAENIRGNNTGDSAGARHTDSLSLGYEIFQPKHYDYVLDSTQDTTSVRSLLEEANSIISHLAFARKEHHTAKAFESRRGRSFLSVDEFDRQHPTVSEADARLRFAQSRYMAMKRLLDSVPTSEYHEIVELWHGFVAQFSSLKLTKPLDRLPALSGLAQRAGPFLGEYIAGMWTSSLLYDLAWRVETFMPGSQPPAQYRGPSWSWVSVDTKACFWARTDMSALSSLMRFGEELPDEVYTAPDPSSQKGPDDSDEDLDEDEHHRSSISTRLQQYTAPPRGSLVVSPTLPYNYFREEIIKRRNLPPKKPIPIALPVSCKVQKGGKNAYGEVSSALLVISALTRPATISSNAPDALSAKQTEEAELHTHGVRIDFSSVESERDAPPAVPFHTFPTHADFDWSVDGSHKLTAGTKVLLLLLFEDISLVLVRKPGPALSKGVWIYRRVGLLRLPEEYAVMYGLSLKQGSSRRTVALV
ncbi:heterokaryon incompatibility protein-domain-containing protein [Podospora aff. communis PSN243]|uniref:Heterokaryon incompatibility protein-domain-containing protein n=1 Tax=Podospora aff. communis PSN243 TaxID=3040156 RepID=A0AAV9FWC1_9PEZI|nr:heterokaryon incompatibility protein-domain-containing protein [Podospora aff. communis PSN243]